jgi:GxxExxY protein
MHINEISGAVVDAALRIHSELGPGLLESVYEVLLAHELMERGIQVERQVPVPIEYRGIKFEEGYRLDLLVEDQIVVEIKSVEEVSSVHKKQFLTYLRLTRRSLGLLLNFNVDLMKNGITRIANQLEE